MTKRRKNTKTAGSEGNKSNKTKAGAVIVILALLILGFLALAYSQCWFGFCSKTVEGSDPVSGKPAKTTTYETPTNAALVKISDSQKLPIEIFQGTASRALPMTADSRTIIYKKYLPDMIGVPKVGEPFRLPLPRPISEKLLEEIFMASLEEMYEYEDVIFVKTKNPDVVFGIVTRVSGEMVDYCDP